MKNFQQCGGEHIMLAVLENTQILAPIYNFNHIHHHFKCSYRHNLRPMAVPFHPHKSEGTP